MARHVLSYNNCPFARGIRAPSNTCFLGPTQVHNPNGISIGSAIFAQFTSQCHRACTSPSKLLLPMGDLYPHLIRGSLGPTNSASEKASHLNQFSRFCKTHGKMSLYFTNYNGRPFPQNCLFPWGIWTPI